MSIRQFLGYHGTSLMAANDIVKNGFKVNKKRDDHWLGQGIYFFNEDIEQAEKWASNRYKNKKSAVIEADIRIPREKVLDLHTREGLKYLSGFLNYLEKKKGLKVTQSKIDCTPKLAHWVFTTISEEAKWVIIKNFLVASYYDGNYGLKALSFTHNEIEQNFSLNSPQLCIKNIKVLEGNVSIYTKKRENKSYEEFKVSKERVPDDLFN